MPRDLTCIVLAAGPGRRLFPISTPRRPKFFARGPDGKSLLLSTLDRLKAIRCHCVVATVVDLLEDLQREVGDAVEVVCIPHDLGSIASLPFLSRTVDPSESSTVAFVPSDQYISDPEEFVRSLTSACAAAPADKLTYLASRLNRPAETRFGYLQCSPDRRSKVRKVLQFVEKPQGDKIVEIESIPNWLVNTGIILGKRHAWNRARDAISRDRRNTSKPCQATYLRGDFDILFSQKHADDIVAFPTTYEWHDLGTPQAYRQALAPSGRIGKVVCDEKQMDLFVLNLQEDHVVEIETSIAADVAVMVANGITCVTPGSTRLSFSALTSK